MDTCAKVVIFNSEDRGVDLVLDVKNYDEKFSERAYSVIDQWQTSTDEYVEFLLDGLKKAGYVVSLSDYTELSLN